MANTIKQKRGTSDPGASDLVVGELAINTTDGGVFTKTDGGTVVEVGSGGGGASAINDLSDAVTKDSGVTIGLGTGALANDDDSDNNNTALGYNALNANTSGAGGVAVGYEAGSATTTNGKGTFVGFECGQNVTGNHVVAVGYQALKGATGTNTAFNNTAIGYQAGTAVTSSGARNSFLGYSCGSSATSAVGNVLLGSRSAVSLTTGSNNVVIGYEACGDGSGQLTTGSNNIVIGKHAKSSSATSSNEITLGNTDITSLRIPGLQSGASDGQVLTFNSTNGNITLADAGGGGGGELAQDSQNNLYAGDSAWQSYTSSDNGHCIAIGETSGQNTTTSNESVFVGRHAGEDVTTANGCVGIGPDCFNNTAGVTGNYNVAISGFLGGGRKLTSGNNNVFVGSRTGENMTTGSSNVVLGDNAGRSSTTATQNVFIGNQAGQNANGSRNICIGNRVGSYANGADNTIVGTGAQYNTTLSGDNNTLIGHDAFASSDSVSNEITLGDTNIATLRCNQTSITSLSDGRDKINVAKLGEGLDFVSRLKPVKFEWKTRDGNSKDGTYEAGFIAQDLQQAQQDGDAEYLGLVMDSNPDRLEASYGKLVPVLVRAIQELKAEIDTLKANAIS
jgi:hypothetical protein